MIRDIGILGRQVRGLELKYLSVAEMAERWGLSERSIRNYCTQGRVSGAFLQGKAWRIPEEAEKPERGNKRGDGAKVRNLLDVLRQEKLAGIKGGIYHKVQIELTYNSNHIEGSRLTHEQTRYIYETNTIGVGNSVNVDDILETANHFRCIDLVIEKASRPLSEGFIKELHRTLKNGTNDSRKDWFAVGEYKKLPNEVGGQETVAPEKVREAVRKLIRAYEGGGKNIQEKKGRKSLEELIEFHHQFERIHPFQDGNGRVGRLLLFKECLRNGIVPFIIDEELKWFYYRGLAEWSKVRGYLLDTCLAAQDKFKKYLEYFRIPYAEDSMADWSDKLKLDTMGG